MSESFHPSRPSLIHPLALLTLAMALSGCAMMGESPEGAAAPGAIVQLQPTAGNAVTGKLTFSSDAGGVLVQGTVVNLKPGTHGFHIHEKGDCSAADGTSAGGHFNPAGAPHGAPAGAHHAGDMGNITAGADGVAPVKITLAGITLDTGPNGIVGRGLIVHADADDLKTQPTGNAGKRLACGVISAAR